MLLRRARPLLGAVSGFAVQQRCAARADESENPPVVERTTRAAPGANPVTQNEQYIKGSKLYDIGILEDPIPGEKRGKGLQHLTVGQGTKKTGGAKTANVRPVGKVLRFRA